MKPAKQEVYALLRQFNPWWEGRSISDLPAWQRTCFSEILKWVERPPVHRAILLSGARQTGKTTLFLQAIQAILDTGIPPESILYLTLDHPLFQICGLEETLSVWREFHAPSNGEEYLFLDEIQFSKGWQTWLKHQVDFNKKRRIVITGSATPLALDSSESGAGRWHTLKLATLSFGEYLQIKGLEIPNLSCPSTLDELFDWNPNDLIRAGETARVLVPHFHRYLLHGGFPQTALLDNIPMAQKLLREDILDKVLKRDMTALFGVRRIEELEKTFLYLCLHDGGILEMPVLCRDLQMKKPTVQRFLDLLEAAHLIIKLPPLGYGKEVLRGRYKVYLADPSMAGSLLLKGQSLLEDTAKLGFTVETAFFKHAHEYFSHQSGAAFSYWRGKKDLEVDILFESGGRLVPMEVKYRQRLVEPGDIKGILTLCREKHLSRAFVITREMNDIGLMEPEKIKMDFHGQILKIPAALACYWLSFP